MPAKRKLAAIMFTDIVGYTAMMQSDEPTGRKKVKRYRDILGKFVEEHHGETLQHYGDGSLTIFSSAVEAIRCAKKIQIELLQEPKVDLKIGVHVGDVFIEDGNIYGDGVNLASRVESMAVQGSILMTERVMHDIKSHPEFEVVSMGKFLFKNVDHPIELYAVQDDEIALPNPWDLKGKGTRVEEAKQSQSPKALVRGIGIGFVGVILGVAIWMGFANTGFLGGEKTREIEFVDEQGNIQKRRIPTMENTNRLVVFPFESKLPDSSAEWMRMGLPYLLMMDLEQNHSLYAISPFSLKDDYDEYSYPYPQDLPSAVKIKIAQDNYSKFFLTGKVSDDQGQKVLDVKVFNTQNGSLTYEKKVTANSGTHLVDALNQDLHAHIFGGLGEGDHIDLPVGDLLSKKEDVLRNYMLAREVMAAGNIKNIDKALSLIDQTIEDDPSCAECYVLAGQLYMGKNDETKGRELLTKAVDYAISLPERQRFSIQGNYYSMHNQVDKYIQFLEKWHDLYPQDYRPLSYLMSYYMSSRQYDKAKELGEEGLKNGHKGNHLLRVANLYSQLEDFGRAEKLYKEYGELYPAKAKDLLSLGSLYIRKGELQKAKDYYEELAVLDPHSYRILLAQADVEDRYGDLDKVEQFHRAALAKAKTARDTFSVYSEMRDPLERLGKFGDSFALAEKAGEVLSTYQPTFVVQQTRIFGNNEGYKFVVSGRDDEFIERLEAFKKLLPQTAERMDCIGYYLYYMFTEDKENFERQSDACLHFFTRQLEDYALMDKGVREKLNGNYEAAIEAYEAYFEKTGSGTSSYGPELAELYRLAGKPDQGLEYIEKQITMYPSYTLYKKHKALILQELGRREEARALMQEVLDDWKEADDSYIEYQEAKEFAVELGI